MGEPRTPTSSGTARVPVGDPTQPVTWASEADIDQLVAQSGADRATIEEIVAAYKALGHNTKLE